MIEINILRGSDTVSTVKPNATSNQQKRIMGQNEVSLSFTLDRMVNFSIGDYAVIFGETYFLNKMPVVKKSSTYNYDYDMVLQSGQYQLQKAQYLFYGTDNTLREAEFTLFGNADTFIDLLVNNVNRVSAGWRKGGVIKTGYKTLTFSSEDCLSVLGKIAKEFATEYYIEDNVIHLAKQSKLTPFVFRYGRNKGLYQITRTQNDQSNVITRLYAFGGQKNLPADYLSQRLRLPGGYKPCLVTNVTYTVTPAPPDNVTMSFNWDRPSNAGVTGVIINYRQVGSTLGWITSAGSANSPRTITTRAGIPYEVQFISTGSECNNVITDIIVVDQTISIPVLTGISLPYLENNVSVFGIIEATIVFDDIYPHRTGTVTATDATNPYKFRDRLIDFDINDQLLPGLAPKITFNTGQLSGYTFEISKFDYTTKEFTLLKNKDEKTLDIPSTAIHQITGDSYVITDIKMPQRYIDLAEGELLAKAQKYLDENSSPRYQYSIECDPKYFRNKRIKINVGNVVWINDTELQVEKKIRVISLTKSLIDEYEYQLELGELTGENIISQLQSSQSNTNNSVQQIGSVINNNALLSGTYIGTFTIKQGTIVIENIETGNVSAMKQLYIDGAGKIWKA